MEHGPNLTLRIRKEGSLITATFLHPTIGPMVIGAINAMAAESCTEVYEDFQALMTSTLQEILKDCGFKIETYRISHPS